MKYLFLISGLIFCRYCNSQSFKVISDWETKREKSGITLQYRWVNFQDTLRTRQMRVMFEIDQQPRKIINSFCNNEIYRQWAVESKYTEIFRINSSEWITYSLYDIPWPLEQKDLITRYELIQENQTLLLKISPASYWLAEKEDVIRIKNFSGEWIFIPDAKGIIQVQFTTISYDKPIVPRFILDIIIQNTILDSCIKLKEITEIQTGHI